MTAALVYIAILFGLILAGVAIAFAIGFAGLIGLWGEMGTSVLGVISTYAWQTTNSFTLSAVPLFILMGEVLFRSGLTDRLFAGLSRSLNAVPGRLLQANVVGATLFAASSGSSVASAAALAPMIYDAEVRQRSYEPRLVLGTLAAGGTLGILIPPSIILILYGAVTGTSVGALFAAGVIPGLLLGAMFMLYVAARALIRPSVVPRDIENLSLAKRLGGVVELWPFVLLAIVVLGSIYGGVATPTESAALGAFLATVLAMAFGRLNLGVLREIALQTVRTTAMLFFIVIAANVMALVLARYGAGAFLTQLASDMSRPQVLALLVVTYLILGCFFDAISMMLLTLPLVMPIVLAAGFDPVWFGIILVVVIEAGLLTPPVGLNLFVVQGSTGEELWEVVRGSAPFVLIQGVALLIFIAFPDVVLWLPERMS